MIKNRTATSHIQFLENMFVCRFQLPFATVVVCTALAWTTPSTAGPMTYTWNMSGSHGPLQYGNQLEFSAGEDSSHKLKVRSYSSIGPDEGIVDAYTDLFNGGIGVKNQYERSSSPHHAIDNSGRHNDLVVFEFGSDDFNVESFKIGWRSNDSDIRIWVGGSGAGLDLRGLTINHLENSLGFTQLPDFWNVAVNAATELNTDITGRYMVVTAGDEYYKDYFKLRQIVAQVDAQDVPEPGTIAMLTVGLAALIYSRRRRKF